MKKMRFFLKSTDGFCTRWTLIFGVVIGITAVFVLLYIGVIPL